MPETLAVRVPDIGEFENVDVVEVLVAPGDSVAAEQSLIVIESDKASMEIPAPAAGELLSLEVSEGSQVSEGDLICTLAVASADASTPVGDASDAQSPGDDASAPAAPTAPVVPAAPEAPAPASGPSQSDAEVLVIGGGPGGYTAAFRAADLGKRVVLVERYAALGGVCLNVGCIPSKALLHMAEVLEEAEALREHGVALGEATLDFARIRARKNEVVDQLTGGLSKLAAARKVRVVQGVARFTGSHTVAIEGDDETTELRFDHAIVAVGSRSVELPGFPDDPRVLDSTSALEVEGPPGRLLVVGGGIIGLEMATVYAAFGWKVSVVELLDQLMTGADPDLVRPLRKRLDARLEQILLGTRVTQVEARPDGLLAHFEGPQIEAGAAPERFDRVLVAVGRRPNGDRIDATRAGLEPDPHGFIPVDAECRSSVPHIFAIGDVTGNPMLAHKATHEGKVAAEVIAGEPASFDARAIPSVAYTDPEVAWSGLTELQAREDGVEITKGMFPWSASGRALGMGRGEGLTKLLFSKQDGRLLGAGIVGPHAGDLIAEATLAIELGADAEDLGLTIHPHPTLSETVAFAAEMAAGTITDLMPPRKR